MGTMDMPLLPQWLRICWAAAYGGVVVLHLWHAWSMAGQRRWWHTGHTVMALGMLLMYVVPRGGHDGPYRAGTAVFGLLAVAIAVVTVALSLREGVLNALWVASAVDMAAMAYMLLPAHTRPSAVSWVFVVYLAGQTLAWTAGVWARIPTLRTPVTAPTVTPAPAPVTTSAPGAMPLPAPAGSGHSGSGSGSSAVSDPGGRSGGGLRPGGGLVADGSPGIRISLAVMAAGMAYMLAVM
ncbi:DUF5134 domain-containing protein [Streptomyces sp. MUM 16J]|nr:DUF5134 domain-containing protein [Streptomyces sp. MUM 16J]